LDKKKEIKIPAIDETLVEPEEDDVLELDELWSYVGNKHNKQWLWLALCRRKRQIVAFFIGDRSNESCQKLKNNIPEKYRDCKTFSDLWESYEVVFGNEKHKSVEKKFGETSHIERFNNTIRQRLARYVRKTLSFSKSENYHYMVTRQFIVNYNLSVTT
jgi:insertion element IS1 protein InsB